MKFWNRRVYADAAAATPLSRGVEREMHRLEKLYGNPGGLHAEGLAAKEELERARKRVARVLGAHADEIFFTSGGTEANNLALTGALRPLLRTHGELGAVTTAVEHPSVLEPLHALEPEGLYITELAVTEEGEVVPKDLREAVHNETALVSVQLINSEVGAMQDIRSVAKEVRHARSQRIPHARALRGARPSPTLASRDTLAPLPLYFHCDAAQAPLWAPLNVEKLGVDLLSLDAQKMMGPKGVGVLYVRRAVELEPVLWGGGQERGLRSGTENVVLAGAFAQALEEAQANTSARAARVAEVRNFLWSEIIRLIPETMLNGPAVAGFEHPASNIQPQISRVPNNLNLSVPGLDGDMAVVALNAEGVAASTRSACASEEEAPSHVLMALGADTARAKEAVRITLLPSATKRDARRIAEALKTVAQRYQNMV